MPAQWKCILRIVEDLLAEQTQNSKRKISLKALDLDKPLALRLAPVQFSEPLYPCINGKIH